RANLFVSALDDAQTWYRYHPLFAEALRTELQELEPALVPELYLRASRWYEEHQSAEEACTYALLAGDLPRVAHLLAGLVPRLMQQGRVQQVSRWLDQLPSAAIAASPELSIASSWMQYLRTPTPEHLERLVEHMEQYVKEKPREVVVSWVELQSELTLHRAFAALDHHDVVRARTLLQKALRSLSAQESALSRLMALRLKMMLSLTYRASGELATAEQLLLETCITRSTDLYDPLNLAAAWCLAKLYEAQGLLRKRGALYERIFQALRPDTDLAPLPLVLLQGSRAAFFYEWNRLSEALHVVQQVLTLGELMDPTAFSGLSAFSRWTQVRIQLAQGQVDTAREALEQKGPPLVPIPIIEREEPTRAAIRARLALACDEIEEAWQWASTSGKHFDDRPGSALSGASYFEYMTLVRILIACGRREHTREALAQALILLGHLRDLVVRLGLDGWFIEIQMLTALALQAQGKTKRALTVLAAVLTEAEPEGYMRLFADEGQPMSHLLAQVSMYTTAAPVYIQQLQDAIAATQPESSQTESHQPLLNPLSAREHEVLLLLAEGASNQQIADRLVISLNTAKLHVKHLLVKLSVTNRTQAVVRALALHLF
ncbi:MAG: hypothetical protein JOZ18_14240, partial [Chloroflexi bacterium]|nr:hypothetical protein [Chloroflexota bacterium]